MDEHPGYWPDTNGNSSTGSSCFVCAFCGLEPVSYSYSTPSFVFCSLECAEKEKSMREEEEEDEEEEEEED